MKIAVTYENGRIFQHFGRTERFKLYETANGAVVSAAVAVVSGGGHGALVDFLKRQGVDTLICGGIGDGARAALRDAGITLCGGADGRTDDAVAALLAGKAHFDSAPRCTHREPGGHGCGGRSCRE